MFLPNPTPENGANLVVPIPAAPGHELVELLVEAVNAAVTDEVMNSPWFQIAHKAELELKKRLNPMDEEVRRRAMVANINKSFLRFAKKRGLDTAVVEVAQNRSLSAKSDWVVQVIASTDMVEIYAAIPTNGGFLFEKM